MAERLISPWGFQDCDFLSNKINIDVFFDTNNFSLIDPGITGHRDAECVYTRIIIGPTDGTGVTIEIPAGDFSFSAQEMNNKGIFLIYDIIDSQFTLSK